MSLDPDPEEMRRLGYLAVDRAIEHLARLGDTPVARQPDPERLRQTVSEPVPNQGRGMQESIDHLFDAILPEATLVNHPRFFAYVPGPGSFAGALGEWLAAATNTFVGTYLGGAVMAELEVEVLDWLRQGMDLPQEFGGVLTSGGSIANLSALAAAMARSRRKGITPSQMAVLVSDETHYSFAKAARTLGLVDSQIRSVATDTAQRMMPNAVRAEIRAAGQAGQTPIAICATLGTTNTGAVDPIAELTQVCHGEDIWLHIDGAYGAAIALLPEERQANRHANGLAAVDSITLDPHKWLYTPFESGCLLTRNIDDLHAAFTADGSYMQDVPRQQVNFFERGPELSRGNRALKLWLLFRGLGLDAIRNAVRHDMQMCQLAHDLLAEDDRLRICSPPRLSIFTFACRGRDAAEAERHGQALMLDLLQDGHLMLSTTRIDGQFRLRFCVVNHRTTEQDIRSSVARIRALLVTPA